MAVPRFITTIPPARFANKRGSKRIGTRGQRGRKGRNNGVACAGHVDDLVGTEDRYRQRLGILLEGHHAVASARDHQRLQAHALHQLLARQE